MNKYVIYFLIVAMICWSQHAIGMGQYSGEVSHVVLIWLKDDVSPKKAENIRHVSQTFETIPNVLSVHVGTALSSKRKMVDDSFDIGVVLRFPNQKAMEAYLLHPIHMQAVEKLIKPWVKKIVVYDIVESVLE